MKKEKSLKQLLKLILKHGDLTFEKGDGNFYRHGFYGLCGFVENLCSNNIISRKEYVVLSKFIHENRPQIDSPHYDFRYATAPYFWRQGVWTPRKLWIIDQINSL